jgi:hypothetical protein
MQSREGRIWKLLTLDYAVVCYVLEASVWFAVERDILMRLKLGLQPITVFARSTTVRTLGSWVRILLEA